MSSRIEKYVKWEQTLGENIDFGSKIGQEVIICLIIDDGVKSRGHRNNIFNQDFRVCGVGAFSHMVFETCIVLDYAGGIKDFEIKIDKGIQSLSKKEPLNFEKLALDSFEAQNKVRSNPKSFIPLLEERLTLFKGNVWKKPGKTGIVTQEGTAVVKECIEYLKKANSLPPMT